MAYILWDILQRVYSAYFLRKMTVLKRDRAVLLKFVVINVIAYPEVCS